MKEGLKQARFEATGAGMLYIVSEAIRAVLPQHPAKQVLTPAEMRQLEETKRMIDAALMRIED